MRPSSGKMNVLNAASTRTGLAIQRISSASRGKSPPNIANKQPILITSYPLLYCLQCQGCRVEIADQTILTNDEWRSSLRPFDPFSCLLPLCMTSLEHKPQHGSGSSPRDAYPLGDFHQAFIVCVPAIGRRIRSTLG